MANITLSIKWDPEWQEFSVPWYEEGKYVEGSTVYEDSAGAARESLAAQYRWARDRGHDVSVRENKHTRGWEEFVNFQDERTGSLNKASIFAEKRLEDMEEPEDAGYEISVKRIQAEDFSRQFHKEQRDI